MDAVWLDTAWPPPEVFQLLERRQVLALPGLTTNFLPSFFSESLDIEGNHNWFSGSSAKYSRSSISLRSSFVPDAHCSGQTDSFPVLT